MPIGGTVQRIGDWIMTRGYTGTLAGAYTDGRAFYVMDDYGMPVRVNEQWEDWETDTRFWCMMTEAEIYA